MTLKSQDNWKEEFFKRSGLLIHQFSFGVGLIIAFSFMLLLDDAIATGAAIAAFIFIASLGIAFRYAVFGDIVLLPRFSLDSYYSQTSKNKPQSKAPKKTREPLIGEGVTGYWETKLDTKAYGSMQITLCLTQKDNEITGSVEGSLFAPMEIESGSISDGRATWKADSSGFFSFSTSFDVRFKGDIIEGEVDFGKYGKATLSGQRSTETEVTASAPPEDRIFGTLPPEEISEELMPTLQELDLVDNCRQLAEEGWTIIKEAADPDFIARLRQAIIECSPVEGTDGSKLSGLLETDPVFAEAAINPKLMAMAEFSVGRGFLLASMVSTIREKDSAPIDLHADQAYFPEPFPAHNMMLTCCWATDEFTLENGATTVMPGTNALLRHPTEEETKTPQNMMTMDCPAGSVAIWDGRVWHANAPKTTDGQRVVLHTSYQRMVVRPNEDFSHIADEMIEEYGEPMAQLMGKLDSIAKKDFDYVEDFGTFIRTTNNAKL